MGRNELKSGRRLVLALCLSVALMVAALMATSTQAQAAALVAGYNFEEGSGTTPQDLSINNYDATVDYNASYSTDVPVGGGTYSLAFNNGRVISPPMAGQVTGNHDWTVSFHLKYTPQGSRQWALYMGDPVNTGAGSGFHWLINTDNTLNAGFWGDAPGQIPCAITPNVWMKITTTYTSATRAIKVYLNDNPEPAVSATASAGLSSLPMNQLVMGKAYTEIGLYGNLDNIMLYDYVNPPVATAPTNGLVAYYPFNGNAIDMSGHSNNGTVNGATLTTDRLGNASSAYSFNSGGSQYISIISSNNLPIGSSPYTISAWIRPTTLGVNGIVGWGNSGATSQENNFRIHSTGELINYWGSNDIISAPGTITTNSWQLVTATFDGSTRKLYLGTTQIASAAASGMNVPYATNASIGRTRLEYFNGSIDEVRIYNRALSAGEVTDVYNASQGTPLNLDSSNAYVSTFAGTGSAGSLDGNVASATFSNPSGVTTDGTYLYVVDNSSNKVRKINKATGDVSTLATVDSAPVGITTDGTNLYIAHWNGSGTVSKVVISSGAVSVVANSSNGLSWPWGITTDGTNLYVGCLGNHVVHKIVIATGAVSVLAGTPGSSGSSDGIGAAARFNQPAGVTTDGTNVFVGDYLNNSIRRIDIATQTVTTLASVTRPSAITTDGTNLFTAGNSSHKISKIKISDGSVSTIAGSGSAAFADGIGLAASFNSPNGVAIYGSTLFIGDGNNNRIRSISSSATVTANATNGSATPSSQNIDIGSTATVTGTADTGYYFTGVSGCGGTAQSNTDQSLTTFSYTTGAITGNCTVTATYVIKTHTVTASATGNGSGTVASSSGGISYSYQANNTGTTTALNYGTSVTLTATASTGSTVSWTTCSGTAAGNGTISATCSYSSLDANKSAQATFTLNQYTITAEATGNGAGTVSSSTGGISYSYQTANTGATSAINHGIDVTLTATAVTGATVAWTNCSGTVSGNGTAAATCSYTSLDANKSTQATFTLTPPTVTTSSATNIDLTALTLNGIINANGNSTTASFQYGRTTSYGTNVSAGTVSAGSGATPVSANITGLACGTTYHIRAVGESSGGTSNGADTTVTTTPCPAGSGPKSIDYTFKPGVSFNLFRIDPAGSPTLIYTGSQLTFTDTAALLPNTIYRYVVSSDAEATSDVIAIRTPLYNGWNIVGVPYNTVGVPFFNLFTTSVANAYRWNPTGSTNPDGNGHYVTVTGFAPGLGYFIKATGSNGMVAHYGTLNVLPIQLTLKPGWTLISNPTPAKMTGVGSSWQIDGLPLDLAVSLGLIGGDLYWWNGTTYDSWKINDLVLPMNSVIVEPWKSYWILNMDTIDHTLTVQ